MTLNGENVVNNGDKIVISGDKIDSFDARNQARKETREWGYISVREVQVRNARKAAFEMGEEAQGRQASLHDLPRSAEVGRQHVCPDKYRHPGSPSKTALALCGQYASSLPSGRIRLGKVHVESSRRSLLWNKEAARFNQGKLAWKSFDEFAARQKWRHLKFQ